MGYGEGQGWLTADGKGEAEGREGKAVEVREVKGREGGGGKRRGDL